MRGSAGEGRAWIGTTSVPREQDAPGTRTVPWRDVPRVVRATKAILRAHGRAGASSTEAIIAIGRQIATIRKALEHGEFLAWAREAVPFGVRTAQNYLALAAWADREPQQVARLAHLGPSKLYRLAALPPARMGELAARTPMPIPGSDEAKAIEVMTVAELDRVIGGLATPPVPRTPVEQIVQGYRYRLAGLRVLTEQLVTRARDVDRSLVSELAAELHGLAEMLEAAFRR